MISDRIIDDISPEINIFIMDIPLLTRFYILISQIGALQAA